MNSEIYYMKEKSEFVWSQLW